MIDWTEIVGILVMVIFTGLIIPLIKAGFGWLKAKTEATRWYRVVEEFESVADKAVLVVQQTFTDELKASSEDGKLTAEEAKLAAIKAFDIMLRDVSQDTMLFIENTGVEVIDYMKDLIESRLALTKK